MTSVLLVRDHVASSLVRYGYKCVKDAGTMHSNLNETILDMCLHTYRLILSNSQYKGLFEDRLTSVFI